MGISYPYQAYNGVNDRAMATYVKTGATQIDFYLESGSNISGKITNKYGQAVPDVAIVTWSKTTGQRAETTSNSNGEYGFINMKTARDYIVAAFPLYYPIQYYKNQTDETKTTTIDLTDGDVFSINFQLNEGYVIQGNVYLDDINQPAPEGIWVNIWSQSTMTGGDISTDINGHFELTGLDPNADDYIISIHHTGYMPTWYHDNPDDNTDNDSSYSMETITGVTPQQLPQSQPMNLILKSGLSIKGKVIYNGRPKEGIQIEAWSEQTGVYGSATTQAVFANNANYTITGLSPGSYQVRIRSNAFKDQELNVILTNYDVRFIDFILQKPEHFITGKIEGLKKDVLIFVNASADTINFNQTVQLSGTGLELPYTLTDLKPASDYIIELFHPNQYLVFDNKSQISNANILNVYGHIPDINFTIITGNKSISGSITFPDTAQQGENVWVEAFSQKTGSLGTTTVLFSNNQTIPYEINGLQGTEDFIVYSWSGRYPETYFNMQTDKTQADFVNTLDTIPDTAINFEIRSGATISGKVYVNGTPCEGVRVNAFSTQANSSRGSRTLPDGTYFIEGLKTSDDFVIEVIRASDAAPFYYNENSTTRERNFAGMISTIDNKHQTGINLELNDFDIIGGIVKDQSGKPLGGIWISVWSSIQQSGHGTFTKDDGSFVIEDLIKSSDYTVSAEPDAALSYISQIKTNISSNNTGIVFTLYTGWSLTGKVLDINGNGIEAAGIELKSTTKQINKWIESQSDGTFTINGLANAQDYMLSVIAPDTASYVPYNDYSMVIESNITKTIILKTGYTISGHVYEQDGQTPLPNIRISAFSESSNAMGLANSDSNGYYEIKNLPQANDYALSAHSENHAKEKATNIASGSTTHFVLQAGGTISGYIRTEAGDPLKNVRVEIKSQSLQIRSVGKTSENGHYEIKGLKKYQTNGSMVNDYNVSIYPFGYVAQTQGPMRVEETANFICVNGIENEISGTVLDHNGQTLTQDINVIVKAYKNVASGGYVAKAQADSEGHFTIAGLSPDGAYYLRVIVFRNGVLVRDQWSGEDDFGVDERAGAKEYRTLENVVFRFGE
jgi:hypothetical protein